VKSPYVLDRNPCGSSSGTGTAIAANLAAVGVGTETDGSIVCPSGANGLVGIKPTVGLVSRTGIIPISHTQDTAGPMTRTVADAAALLNGMVGRDPADAATTRNPAVRSIDYSASLQAGALKGARIGVARKRYAGYSPAVDERFDAALAVMKGQGAVIVDPADIATAAQLDDCEFQILLYEFKADLNAYLRKLPSTAPVHSLADLIAFNEREKAREMPYFGQETFVLAQPTGGPAWTTDLVNGDHFVGASSTPAAVAGYPSITVPAGDVLGLPVGLAFIGKAWSEPRLIALAYAYEQASKLRQPPAFLPQLSPLAR
jgi:amidase